MKRVMPRKSSKALVSRRNMPARRTSNPMTNINTLVLLALIALVFYFLLRNRSSQTAGSYDNVEKWRVDKFNEEGVPIEVTIERHFTRA